ncbi:ABC transporter ATP-binding protein [Arthrospiribacter ruber]|uniref:ABC transporter ATP-binding protein n=1 Tax=Arthrospiribacter ruber TaxID=2487934 RepID=A0A951J1N3_9BACT|nr:ABC transporter ATP-binding protein [Arthrospiribacter ruber]
MLRLLEIAGTKKGLLLLSCALAIVHALLLLIPYILVFFILEELTSDQIDRSLVINYLWYAGIAVTLSYAILYASGMASHVAAFDILYQLRKSIAHKLGKLPMGFLNDRTSGGLKKVLSDDVERIENFIAHQIPDFVKGLVVPIATIIFLFTQDWRLAIISFIPLLVLMIWMPIIFNSKKNKELMGHFHQSLENMNSGIVEYVRAMPVMKIFGQNADEFEKYGKTVKEFDGFVKEWTRKTSPPFAIFMSFMSNALLPVLVLGIWLYMNNGIGLATLLLFLILGIGYLKPVFALANMGSQLTVINQGVKKIDEILNSGEQEESKISFSPKSYDIRFQHVHFSYGNTIKALEDINFCLPAKSLTALVGPSGAGKSTVAQLIARFWDIQEGKIFIGGIDIKDIPLEELMKTVSFVFQDSFIFQASIRENIMMGMDKSEKQMIEAAIAAQIHDKIQELPDGYDTRFGESGIHLSGGEQQRIQLARAILKDAPILILDEATAFADPENEAKIQEAFSALIHDKTVIIIAHRLSTITDSDQILVFDEGKLEGQGKHEDLLISNGLYQKMWSAHQRAKEFTISKN